VDTMRITLSFFNTVRPHQALEGCHSRPIVTPCASETTAVSRAASSVAFDSDGRRWLGHAAGVDPRALCWQERAPTASRALPRAA
jgi:hypothetical protein